MRFFDTFTGYGGFTLGIQRAYELSKMGVESENRPNDKSESPQHSERPLCIGFSEIDKYAISVYQKHFPEHKNYGDITQINPQFLPDFDLITGGFPCQAFSIAGKRRGFDDTRGTLFFDIARILREKKPRWVVLENVKGLLSHDNGRTFKTIISTLVELGYGVEWQVLNAKNYGVPQNRERVFIVGNLGGERTGQVFPIGEANSKGINELTTGASQGYRLYGTDGINTTLASQAGGLGAKTGLIAPTIRATEYKHGDNQTTVAENGMKIRRLTPTECERLMGLPDGWLKYGADGKEISDSQRYKMAGNGVVVNVVEAVIKRIKELDKI